VYCFYITSIAAAGSREFKGCTGQLPSCDEFSASFKAGDDENNNENTQDKKESKDLQKKEKKKREKHEREITKVN
jgi:hypothetical protein